ncbi:hypothetical protein JWG43_17770, partial [Desulfobulbus alkaliphilus]
PPRITTNPLHQYAPQAPYPPAQPAMPSLPQTTTASATSPILAVGLFGVIVVATGTLGQNLHRVGAGDMSMTEAVSDSLHKGAIGGIAAASATAAASSLTGGGLPGLAVTVATATGMSYLLGRP